MFSALKRRILGALLLVVSLISMLYAICVWALIEDVNQWRESQFMGDTARLEELLNEAESK